MEQIANKQQPYINTEIVKALLVNEGLHRQLGFGSLTLVEAAAAYFSDRSPVLRIFGNLLIGVCSKVKGDKERSSEAFGRAEEELKAFENSLPESGSVNARILVFAVSLDILDEGIDVDVDNGNLDEVLVETCRIRGKVSNLITKLHLLEKIDGKHLLPQVYTYVRWVIAKGLMNSGRNLRDEETSWNALKNL